MIKMLQYIYFEVQGVIALWDSSSRLCSCVVVTLSVNEIIALVKFFVEFYEVKMYCGYTVKEFVSIAHRDSFQSHKWYQSGLPVYMIKHLLHFN